MDTSDIYNNPIIARKRKGTPDDPYIPYGETLAVINGKVSLTEVPNESSKVIVTDPSNFANLYYEIDDGSELLDNYFSVDYVEGVVFFNSANEGKSLKFAYTGTGAHFFPAQRVWLTKDKNDVLLTIDEKFDDVDTEIDEQKARVDNLITSVPQPDEAIDARVDHDGTTFATLKDRIDNEQMKIEEAYEDRDGTKFDSLKDRIDAEQKKIEDTYLSADGITYSSLKNRLDTTDTKIDGNISSINILKEVIVNVKDPQFGAKGDGVTDDTSAVQAAINYLSANGGGTVWVPPGTYKCSTINLASNIIFKGSGNATVFVKTQGTLFNGSGSFGSEIAFAADKTVGDTQITTVSNHGLLVGDLVLLKSQRDSLGDDATDQWRLGYATPDAQGCYFGEFGRVISVDSNVGFTLTSGLIFPSYYKDNTRETVVNARTSATILKFNPIHDVYIRDLKITGTPSTGIFFEAGHKCFVENVSFDVSGDGSFITFQESYMCKGYNNSAYYDASVAPSSHFSRNTYKSISSYLCGFEHCFSENGTQSFDITYISGSVPSSHCFVKNCETKGAINNAMTSHGGTFGILVEGNMFSDNVSNGISIRTRNSIISGNRLTGTTPISNYGIALYEGWSRDCVITNNSVTSFGNAFDIIDATDQGEWFTWVGCVIQGNTINNCNIGLYTDRNSGNTFSGSTGIQFRNNVMEYISGTSGKLVYLMPYVADVLITGNVFVGTTGANAGVYARENTTNLYIDGNSFRDAGSAIWCLQPTDTTVFPSNKNTIYVGDNNDIQGITTLYKFDTNVGLKGVTDHFGNFHPYIDGVSIMGWSQRRWSAIYSVSGVINTSDANLKTDIQPETLGLDFVNQLQPKTFKFTDNESNRTHHGLIAQDVETLIDSLGISLDDFAVVTKTQELDDNGNPIDGQYIYGLRYTEFIGIMVKAIQELNAKINPTS